MAAPPKNNTTKSGNSPLEETARGDVCGPFGAGSWQSLYSTLHIVVLEGRRPPKVLVGEGTGGYRGGLGDRMKGIHATFVVALVTLR